MSTNKKSSNNALAMTLLKGRTFIVLIVLLIFFSIKAANFLSLNTAMLIAKHVALYGILGIGMTYVIITGGIDLSVGAIVGLAGMDRPLVHLLAYQCHGRVAKSGRDKR